MLSGEFLNEFKRETERRWRKGSLDPRIYGFQIQTGTRWYAGLSDQQIAAYEKDVGIRFPADFKMLLRGMNGTDLPALNIYGSSGEPARESVGVYSYPRDLALVLQHIPRVSKDWDVLRATLAEQGFDLPETAKLMPIYAHRFVVCDGTEEECSVISIWDSEDAIVYGNSLREYLEKEFLNASPR